MKRFFYASMALAALVGVTSCSQDDVKVPAQDGVTFTVQLPRSVQSRGTFGDGTDNGDRATLNNLQYSVYEVTNNVTAATPLFSGAVDNAFTTDQTQETVTIPLAKGKSYQVVFYADDSDNNFVTYTDGTINVVYANSESNVAAEDAFVGKSEQFTVNGAYSETVTLTRPFAQLNWGSDDTDAKVLTEVLKTLEATVTVSSGLYTSMDVLTGTVSDQVTTATTLGTVSFASLPEQTFPVAGTTKPYALIAMNYLLTGNGTINCELSFSDTDIPAVEVSAAPVQINHRTNIYGSLLTNPGLFNIIVDNNFGDGDNNVEYPVKVKTPEQFMEAIADGGDITVAGNVDLTNEASTITIDKPTVLNVEGTLTVATNQLNVTSELTVDGGGTINSNGFAIIGSAGSKIIIKDAVISAEPTLYYQQAINTSGSLEIYGGRIESNGRVALTLNWANNTQPESLVINGGEIVGGNDYALNIYAGNSSATHTATINGGTFIGNSGGRADGSVNVTINGGNFIQKSTNSTGHGFCAGAESYGSAKCNVTINGGYFYGDPGYAICRANQAKLVVNCAILNKTGGGYTLGEGKSVVTLNPAATLTIGDDTYSFGYEVK